MMDKVASIRNFVRDNTVQDNSIGS